MTRTKAKRRTDPNVVNVGIPVADHKEIDVFAREAGLKIKQVPSVLWRTFKTLPLEQQEIAVKEFRRSLVHG